MDEFDKRYEEEMGVNLPIQRTLPELDEQTVLEIQGLMEAIGIPPPGQK